MGLGFRVSMLVVTIVVTMVLAHATRIVGTMLACPISGVCSWPQLAIVTVTVATELAAHCLVVDQ